MLFTPCISLSSYKNAQTECCLLSKQCSSILFCSRSILHVCDTDLRFVSFVCVEFVCIQRCQHVLCESKSKWVRKNYHRFVRLCAQHALVSLSHRKGCRHTNTCKTLVDRNRRRSDRIYMLRQLVIVSSSLDWGRHKWKFLMVVTNFNSKYLI